MILFVIAVVLAVLALVRSKPSYRSFEDFYRTKYLGDEPKKAKKGGWLTGVFDALLPSSTKMLPPTVMHNCVAFIVAAVKVDRGQTAYFLGVFGRWLPLLAPPSRAAVATELRDAAALDQAVDAARQEAIDLKASGSYAAAAAKFTEVAEGAAGHDDMEAGDAYEQAAKCAKMARDLERQVEATERAVAIFTKQRRPTKAALLYESLIDRSQPPEQQLAFQLKAEQHYDAAEDRRASMVRERVAHLYGQTGQFKRAAEYFARRSEELFEDPLLIHAARRNYLYRLCALSLERGAAYADAEYPGWFGNSEENRLYEDWLQFYEGELAAFKGMADLPEWLRVAPADLC